MKSKPNLFSLLSEIEKAAQLKPSRRLLRLFARRLVQMRREQLSASLDHSKASRLPVAKSSASVHRRR